MSGTAEQKIFEDYIRDKNLRYSRQRTDILGIFLNTEKHLTAEELYETVKKKYPGVGRATVYRTLKLICDCGIGRELRLEDGILRYEHLYGHEHHDHLICIECGRSVEVFNPKIEQLQEEIASKEGFIIKRHRLQIYGICKNCKKRG